MKETQSLRDAVNTFRRENEDLRKENSKHARALHDLSRAEEAKLKGVVVEMEEKRRSEVEKVETLCRKRIEVATSKQKRLEDAKDDAIFAMEEKMVQAQKQNADDIEKLHQSYQAIPEQPPTQSSKDACVKGPNGRGDEKVRDARERETRGRKSSRRDRPSTRMRRRSAHRRTAEDAHRIPAPEQRRGASHEGISFTKLPDDHAARDWRRWKTTLWQEVY